MLTVYTYSVPKPDKSIDLSEIPLNELAQAAQSVFQHQKDIHVWLGYLEGWMLTPHEEVILRSMIRKFQCSLVTRFPHSLSHAWKNEIKTIYTSPLNGDPATDNHGRSLHDGCAFEH
jgi:hypothetical protein